jgi:hypothetical protein
MAAADRLLPAGFLETGLRDDARAGLAATPKSLPPKWFYDAQGWWRTGFSRPLFMLLVAELR